MAQKNLKKNQLPLGDSKQKQEVMKLTEVIKIFVRRNQDAIHRLKLNKMRTPRVNNKIRSNEVQLITHEGENIGVVPIGEAINRAQEVGLDLIEIAPNVKPPVCKIIDHGKYKYELQKKPATRKKKQR